MWKGEMRDTLIQPRTMMVHLGDASTPIISRWLHSLVRKESWPLACSAVMGPGWLWSLAFTTPALPKLGIYVALTVRIFCDFATWWLPVFWDTPGIYSASSTIADPNAGNKGIEF
jgi:hypothetical protein